jgi:hypothetical protein
VARFSGGHSSMANVSNYLYYYYITVTARCTARNNCDKTKTYLAQ